MSHMPLALCDCRSPHGDDLVPSDIVYPHLELEASESWYNADQLWYYLKDQMINEVFLIMNVDSGRRHVCLTGEQPAQKSLLTGALLKQDVLIRRLKIRQQQLMRPGEEALS